MVRSNKGYRDDCLSRLKMKKVRFMSAIFHRYDQGRRNLIVLLQILAELEALPDYLLHQKILLIAQSYFHTFRQLYK